MTLQQARQNAASRYPETLVDTKGRKHRCIPREAILAGKWDEGEVVRRELVDSSDQELPRP